MSALVEAMTRAIGECLYCHVDPIDTPNTWGMSESAALAALKAMREPTEAMLDAGADIAHECVQYSLEPGEGIDGYDMTPAWQAMIDAAIQEHSTTPPRKRIMTAAIPDDIRKLVSDMCDKYVGYEGPSEEEVCRALQAERNRATEIERARCVQIALEEKQRCRAKAAQADRECSSRREELWLVCGDTAGVVADLILASNQPPTGE